MVEEKQDETENSNTLSLQANIEALLFISPTAVSPSQLASALDVTPREVELALQILEEMYVSRGIRIQRHRGQIQLTSAPESAAAVERLLHLEATTSLSRAALETLSIIAYQQPVTRPQIDSIRGVNSDSVIRNLLNKGLIEESGRSEGPGRPILYVTAPEFLQHFGLSTLKELPPLQLPEPPPLEETPPPQPELPLKE
ncbi:SMC-Scp complex subunit ScpB [Chloroflexota bacterium]